MPALSFGCVCHFRSCFSEPRKIDPKSWNQCPALSRTLVDLHTTYITQPPTTTSTTSTNPKNSSHLTTNSTSTHSIHLHRHRPVQKKLKNRLSTVSTQRPEPNNGRQVQFVVISHCEASWTEDGGLRLRTRRHGRRTVETRTRAAGSELERMGGWVPFGSRFQRAPIRSPPRHGHGENHALLDDLPTVGDVACHGRSTAKRN